MRDKKAGMKNMKMRMESTENMMIWMKSTGKRSLIAVLTAMVLLAVNGCGTPSAGNGASVDGGSVKQQADQQGDQAQTSQQQGNQTQNQGDQAQQPGGQTQQANSEAVEAAVDHLLTVWSNYLQTLNDMYASELWALDYTDKFLETSDWTDLSRARTACVASARYLSEVSMTEEDLTQEEYLVLAQAGMDTAYQSLEFQSVQELADGAHQDVRDRLLVTLEGDVFSVNSVDILEQETELYRDAVIYMCQYHCASTNYMLLDLKDEKRAMEYWKAMQENYPVLTAAGYKWLDDENSVQDEAEKVLNDYETIFARQADILSALNADVYRLQQIIENNDGEALAASVHRLSGAPDLLPAPVWYNPEYAKYLSFVYKEDGSILYPETGEELTEDFYGVYLQVENISREDVEEYMEKVKELAYDVWEAEEGVWFIAMKEYNVQVKLQDNLATIMFLDQDITFAPGWYVIMLGV